MYTAYGYDAVHAILGDGEAFSSAGYGEVMGLVMGRSILEMDEPEHHTYRSILQQAFTRGEMARWETELVGPLVDRMVDEFADGGGADLVRQLLFPFPVRVIAALLGLPEEDLPEFHRLAVELIGVTVNWDRAVESSAKLREYFSGIVAERRLHPADDMISVLVSAEQDGQHLDDEEIYAFLPPAPAGRRRDDLPVVLQPALRPAHPSRPVRRAAWPTAASCPAAIEEGIRWEPPLLIIIRSATRDIEVDGVTIPAGASVVCNLGSANHDRTRWDDAGGVRHLPRAPAPHRLRPRAPHVPGHAPRPHGDPGGAERAVRPAARACASTPTPTRPTSPGRSSGPRPASTSSGTEPSRRAARPQGAACVDLLHRGERQRVHHQQLLGQLVVGQAAGGERPQLLDGGRR